MNIPITDFVAIVLALLLYFGGVLIWPIQACIRRRWDKRSKALASVCGIHAGLVGVLIPLTDYLYGGDAHHAWWFFVVLNFVSLLASYLAWFLAAQDVKAQGQATSRIVK